MTSLCVKLTDVYSSQTATLTAVHDESLASLRHRWAADLDLDPSRFCLRTASGAFLLSEDATLRSLLGGRETSHSLELFLEPLVPVDVAVHSFSDTHALQMQVPLSASPEQLDREVCRRLQSPPRHLRWTLGDRRLSRDLPLADQEVAGGERLVVDLEFHFLVERLAGRPGEPLASPREVYCFGSESASDLLLDPTLPPGRQRLLLDSEPLVMGGPVAAMLARHGGVRRCHWMLQLEQKMTVHVQYPAPRGWVACPVWPSDPARQLLDARQSTILLDEQQLDPDASFHEQGVPPDARLWLGRAMALRIENSRGVVRDLHVPDSISVRQLRRQVAHMEPTPRYRLQFDGGWLEPEQRLLHRCGVTDGSTVRLVRSQLPVILAHHGRHFSLGYIDVGLLYRELLACASQVLGVELDQDTVFECATCRRTVSMETKAQGHLPARCCEVRPRLLRVHRAVDVQLRISTRAQANATAVHTILRSTATSLHELMAFVADQLQRERDLAEDELDAGVPLSEVSDLGDSVRLHVSAEVDEALELGTKQTLEKRSDDKEADASRATWWWWSVLSWFRSRDHSEVRQPQLNEAELHESADELGGAHPTAKRRPSYDDDCAFSSDKGGSLVVNLPPHGRNSRMASTCSSVILEDGVQAAPGGGSRLPARDDQLLDVTLSRDPDFIHRFIKSGGNVNSLLSDGTTLLAVAALSGQEETVKMLLDAGAAVDGICKNGVSPLHLAADEGHEHLVERLLESGATIDVTLKDGSTPLLLAVKRGHLSTIRALLSRGANANATLTNGVSGLYIAAENGFLAVARMLVEHDAKINLARRTGATPVFIAAQTGRIEMVRLLIRAGADFDQPMKNGATPLYIACQNGNWSIVRLLVDANANINLAMENGATPLICSAQNGQTEILSFLLRNGASGTDMCEDGTTAIFLAAQNGHLEVVRRLVASGVDANAACDNGATPLFIASQNGHADVVRFLLENGADIDSACNDGATPLYVAAQNGHTDIVFLLIEEGADVQKGRKDQVLPVHIAKQQGHTEIVSLLKNHRHRITRCLQQ